MSDNINPDVNADAPADENELEEQRSRRNFLRSLGKWSAVLIGAAVGGSLLDTPHAASWLNGGGGAWINARGGYGGGSWVNRSGGGGGGAWINGGGGGGAWVNRRGY